MIKINLLNQQLKAIQNSKAYCKKELEKTEDPHIRQKIQHYYDELKIEEEQILKELKG